MYRKVLRRDTTGHGHSVGWTKGWAVQSGRTWRRSPSVMNLSTSARSSVMSFTRVAWSAWQSEDNGRTYCKHDSKVHSWADAEGSRRFQGGQKQAKQCASLILSRRHPVQGQSRLLTSDQAHETNRAATGRAKSGAHLELRHVACAEAREPRARVFQLRVQLQVGAGTACRHSLHA